MSRLLAALVGCLASACAITGVENERAVNLVVLNDSDVSVFWSVEQPTGEMTRFELEPCSSTSEVIAVGQAWEVEWGATFAVTSDDVRPLDAPYTEVNVRYPPDGTVRVDPPQASAEPRDAPLDFTCGES